MGSPQRRAGDKALQRLVAEREFAQRQRPFRPKAALPQPQQMFRQVVFRPVNNAQIFPAAHLERRLEQALRPDRAKSSGLTTMPSPPRAVSSSHQATPSAQLAASAASTCRRFVPARLGAPFAASRSATAMCQR